MTIRSRSGFTLLELLIVSLIMALLTGAIVACLAGGLRVWERARNFGEREGAALLFFAECEADLHNLHIFQAIPFEGTANAMSFATLVRDSSQGDVAATEKVGTVKYYQAGERGDVQKKTWTYPDAEPPDFEGDLLFSSPRKITFSFHNDDEEGGGGPGAWTDTWTDVSNFPSRVRVEISCDTGKGEVLELNRTVLVPVTVAEEGGTL